MQMHGMAHCSVKPCSPGIAGFDSLSSHYRLGSAGRDRTSNLWVQNPAFCQLNYRRLVGAAGIEPATFGLKVRYSAN